MSSKTLILFKGMTQLINNKVVTKDHPVLEACGDVDELETLLGVANEYCKTQENGVCICGSKVGN